MIWLRGIGAKVWGYAVLTLAILGAIWRGVRLIRRSERDRIAAERAQDFIDTSKRLDNADTSTGDPDADLEWLRNRNEHWRR